MVPSATYRVQFRNGMTFDSAIDLIPHLKALSISHLYASPVFTSTSGSTHGYDVTDANAIDPAIGGCDGFERMAKALQEAGIGLILDIVPNHMAASVENAWWRDVLHRGKTSQYAGHFDIDWSEKLTLPILGQSLDDALAAGELAVIRDPDDGSIGMVYFETVLPLSDESIEEIVAAGEDEASLAELSKNADRLKILLQHQHWQLTHWKEAASHLSYRRFFEVTGLVGMRVEDEAVFNDTHRLIAELVTSGQVQGLRIDHIDGLADPSGYLDRLRAAVGPETYIVVEKILGPNEEPPPSWPIAGTTGYEFISALSHALIDGKGLNVLREAYNKIDSEAADYEGALRKAKQLMVQRNFEGEIERLAKLGRSICPVTSDEHLRNSIQELLIAFPVYRTYGYRGRLKDHDVAILQGATERARPHVENGEALTTVEGILLGETGGDDGFEFRARFQQLSGPVMAKALEDTLFYRHNLLIAANEVGGEPDEPPGGVAAFHDAMSKRLDTQADALSASSTHDTKRGEDARARLYTISEGASAWAKGVERWREMNRQALTHLADGAAPEPNVEWMLYQSLAGIWQDNPTTADLAALRDRFLPYAEKAVKEAKLRTGWTDPDEDYENSVMKYAEALLSPGNNAFLKDFGDTMKPFQAAGVINSLSQTVIKLTAPGVPDIYQGTQGLDFSLVDPDNRRPVDHENFVARGHMADGTPSTFEQRKFHVVRNVLAFRRENADLFAKGSYLPVSLSGKRKDHIIAFVRVLDGRCAITLVPRLVFGHVDFHTMKIPAEFWEDTAVEMPAAVPAPTKDAISERYWERQTLVSSILQSESVALLVKADPLQ